MPGSSFGGPAVDDAVRLVVRLAQEMDDAGEGEQSSKHREHDHNWIFGG